MRIVPLLILLFLLSATAVPAVEPPPAGPGPFGADPAAPAFIELGSESYRGVVASARLEPLAAAGGGARSYLLSVAFSRADNGRPLEEGDVAVKISADDGREGPPLRLLPADGRFRAEISLSAGESLLRIGSKLADEKKRIYRFFYTPG